VPETPRAHGGSSIAAFRAAKQGGRGAAMPAAVTVTLCSVADPLPLYLIQHRVRQNWLYAGTVAEGRLERGTTPRLRESHTLVNRGLAGPRCGESRLVAPFAEPGRAGQAMPVRSWGRGPAPRGAIGTSLASIPDQAGLARSTVRGVKNESKLVTEGVVV
jgi:hypothetical protein